MEGDPERIHFGGLSSQTAVLGVLQQDVPGHRSSLVAKYSSAQIVALRGTADAEILRCRRGLPAQMAESRLVLQHRDQYSEESIGKAA
jgi:hypothetical protein